VKTREFVARRFQLNGGRIGREISDVGPIEHFDSFLCPCKAGGRESSPESLEAHVSTGHAPVARRLNDLNIVDAHYSFAINIDELFVEHVASKQDFAFATHERSQIENVRVQAHAVLIELSDAPTREEEVTTTITRDETSHRRMIVGAETHDDVFHRGDTFTFEVAYRTTQDLRQIKHSLGMIQELRMQMQGTGAGLITAPVNCFCSCRQRLSLRNSLASSSAGSRRA
jgi:hypothetical protein